MNQDEDDSRRAIVHAVWDAQCDLADAERAYEEACYVLSNAKAAHQALRDYPNVEQTNISPELAAVLDAIVTALETTASNFVGGVTPSVNVVAAALAARAALVKALHPIADDAGGAV